jgi:predicted ATPase with chaperone activity
MIGPPGVGKTLLARVMAGILPGMSIDKALDVTRVYSMGDAPTSLARERKAFWPGICVDLGPSIGIRD